MFKSVKSKLTSISVLTFIGFLIFVLFLVYYAHMQNKYNVVYGKLDLIEKKSMMMKNHAINIDNNFFNVYNDAKVQLDELRRLLKDLNLDTKIIKNQEDTFAQTASIFENVYNQKEMIDKKTLQIKELKKLINDNFKDVSDYKLLYLLKNLESYEKDFFFNGHADLKEFNISQFKLRRSVRASFNFTTDKQKQKLINQNFIKYKKLFLEIVQSFEDIENYKAQMNDTIQNNIKSLTMLQKHIYSEVSKSNDNLFNIILFLALIIALLVFILAKYVSNGIVSSLKEVKIGLNGFFDVINHKSNDAKLIEIKSQDEFGLIAESINENIKHSVQLILHNKEVLEEANDVLQKVANGFYSYKIPHHNNVSPDVKSLIINVNKMMDETKQKFDVLNDALQSYGKYEFDITVPKKNQKGLYGDFGTLIASTKLIGNNVSELLAMILNTGNKLNNDTNVLKDSSLELSETSNQQAVSLEETAALIEDVADNINSNSRDVIEMSSFANELSKSSISGKNLAKSTADSMDEINKQISSILEAIQVIDKIAFQTNILSLNAAVEAATAGEAGKGFAVVAAEVRNLASNSANAAKEIKEIVQKATIKANEGKKISTSMQNGYEELNNKIEGTINLIDKVSKATNEQNKKIKIINETVNSLDENTQKNANNAKYISDLSNSISQMADDLMIVSSNATFKEEVKKQVCDVNLVYKTSQMKNDHLSFKIENYEKVGTFKKWDVKSHTECSLGKWIEECEKKNEKFVNSQYWNELKHSHKMVHENMQVYINENAQSKDNEKLRQIAENVENETLIVFDRLNDIKILNCDNLNSM